MEEDLNNAPFLDNRTLDFIGKVLHGGLVSPISAAEQRLAKSATILKDLNNDLDGELIPLLRGYCGYIPVPVGIAFLLEARRRGELETAKEILYYAERDEYSADLPTLLEILEESKDAPAGMILLIKGRHAYNRHVPPPTENLSRLNLEAMRNFK